MSAILISLVGDGEMQFLLAAKEEEMQISLTQCMLSSDVTEGRIGLGDS